MTELDDDPGGWDTYSPPDGADGLHLRWARDAAGRWVITDLYLHGQALTADMLRAISLPRMEAQRNSETGKREKRYWPAEDEGLTTAELRHRAEMRVKLKQAEGGAHTRGWELLSAWAPPGWIIPATAPRERITRPDRSDPEALAQFYRRVAMAYRQYAQTRAPAPAIAEEAGVPVTTVHRWVREARRRGDLPPGRKGKVG